jgi:hypothetical protein
MSSMVVITRKDWTKGLFDSHVERLVKAGIMFHVERSGSCREIVYASSGVRKRYYLTNEYMSGVHLVRQVQVEVIKRIAAGLYVPKLNEDLLKARYNISSLYSMYNSRGFERVLKEFEGFMIGVDINDCYWSTLFRIGAVSERVYLAGLKGGKSWKLARNTSIGAMNKKRITCFYNAKGEEEYKRRLIEENDLAGIRYDVITTVYEMAVDIAKELGDDFCYFATDCFYVTPTATDKVRQILKDKYNYESKFYPEKIVSFKKHGNSNYVLTWRQGQSKDGGFCKNFFNVKTHIDNN